MLDGVTKKRIDTLRQILVGKLPDPKAQVEQITNGLIYKFMNDMDEESISMGGKSTYFSGKYQKYSWKNLLDTKTSGIEKLSLYSEAIEQMYNNENLPELFREIFKNSFLPFKDPSTLNMFLKEINEFHYSNSEKLGDAFEYLLSFMGSQGDAGQFRTPRHIIDFIVEIVNPQKNETILDPACGTAGFLISSYKHILKQNTKKNLGDGLTASDRKKIGENLNGYDISPDMVKMSLVNMYLHKFTNPKINEYDTLSSEDKWNEYYDVILANPPFFSPKGGIMPHNRFGVKSTKAEVLFVDYINEHLKPNGRAGIIVPEGIIFQTGTAYKQLRKKLLETSLIGVISLPAGVFQPYSGVKTSILILDKEKNKKNNKIFFINIKNDGFDLTANRKKGKENDLPKIVQLIKNDEISKLENVKKEEIVKNDFSLNYSSYKNDEIINSNYKLVLLKDYADLKRGTSITKEDITDGDIPVIAGGQKPAYFNNKSNRNSNCITVSSSGAYAGYVAFHTNPIFASDCFTIETNNTDLKQKFLFYLLKSKQELIYTFQTGGGQPHVYAKDFDKFKIPLPSLEKQNELVEELDSYQKIINGCRQVIENYKPLIDIDPKWEIKPLGDYITINNGQTLTQFDEDGDIAAIKVSDMNLDKNKTSIQISNNKVKSSKFKPHHILKPNSIIFPKRGAAIATNKKRITKISCIIDNNCMGITVKNEKILLPDYLFYFLIGFNLSSISKSAGIALINNPDISSVKIPMPNISKQNEIIQTIKQELKIVDDNYFLIETFNQKIDNTIKKIWNN
jgi:type I restriction enzyme M protein